MPALRELRMLPSSVRSMVLLILMIAVLQRLKPYVVVKQGTVSSNKLVVGAPLCDSFKIKLLGTLENSTPQIDF
jgi:hypothetical protein